MKFGMVLSTACTLVVVGLLCRPASAQVIYDNFGPGNTYDTGNGWSVGGPTGVANQTVGQPFTPGTSGNLSLIELAMGYVAGPNHFDVTLYDDSAGLPGSVIETFSLDNIAGTFGFANAPVAINSVTNPFLSAGITYWIVASSTNDSWLAWNVNTTGDSGQMAFAPSGGSFFGTTNPRGALRVTLGDAAVPEPGTIGLLAGMIVPGTAILIRRRRA